MIVHVNNRQMIQTVTLHLPKGAGKGSNSACKPDCRRNCEHIIDIVTTESCYTLKISKLVSVWNVSLCYLPDISKGGEEGTVSSASPIQFSRVREV